MLKWSAQASWSWNYKYLSSYFLSCLIHLLGGLPSNYVQNPTIAFPSYALLCPPNHHTLSLDDCTPSLRFLCAYAEPRLPRSPPHSSPNGPLKMEMDHTTPLLRISYGSRKNSKTAQAPHGTATTTPSSFSAALVFVHPPPATLASLHYLQCTEEILASTIPWAWDIPSSNTHLADSHTTFQEFCSNLSSHSGLSWLP